MAELYHPWLALLLPLALLPLRGAPLRPAPYSWQGLVPEDTASRGLDWVLRLAGAGAVAGLVLGLGGLHRPEYAVERVGTGSRLVLLLDRSKSMDDGFAGRASGGEESKSAAASRLLEDFVGGRGGGDLLGVAAFSSAPLFVLPLTGNRPAVLAAVRAMKLPGLAQTDVARGLALALSYFAADGAAGPRSLLLVSDGAALVDAESERILRREFQRYGVRLYWIYLRTAGGRGLFESSPDPAEDTPEARPERSLHQYFGTLGVPYQAFEADNPASLEKAVAEVDRREQTPLRYREKMPRRELSGACFALAALLLLPLLVAKRLEIVPWQKA
jgi:mxaC protein